MLVTVNVKVVVIPPVPVTVIVDAPTGVVSLVSIVSVVTHPGEQEVGLNEATASEGNPLIEKLVLPG